MEHAQARVALAGVAWVSRGRKAASGNATSVPDCARNLQSRRRGLAGTQPQRFRRCPWQGIGDAIDADRAREAQGDAAVRTFWGCAPWAELGAGLICACLRFGVLVPHFARKLARRGRRT